MNMKQFLIIWLLNLCCTAWVFSQDALREFDIEKVNDSQVVFYRDKGCTPDVGAIVFYTTIQNLKFSMPDTPNRLKSVSAYDKENNCYVLCIQPTDTKVGGISKYSIAITANGYKPMPAFMVSGITPGIAQYFMINPKRKEVNGSVAGSNEQDAISDNKTAPKVAEKLPKLSDNFGKQHNVEVYNPDGIELVYVEGKGIIKGFYIGKFEVTQKQWKAIMGKNPSYFKGDNLPVEMVSWNDVQEFLFRLNALTGRNYRLPTQAEWEFAARGGSASKGYIYSGSNGIAVVAWFKENSNNRTHPVGTKQPNELGIYDMSGNVWEWCEDLYWGGRIVRGGSWGDKAKSARVSAGIKYYPYNLNNFLGFRVVL